MMTKTTFDCHNHVAIEKNQIVNEQTILGDK